MHLGSLAMDSLTNPANMAAMRAPPVIPIKLHEFNLQVHPISEATLCHMHYSPAPAPEPTPPPSPPHMGVRTQNQLPEKQSVNISALPTPEFINTHGRNSGIGENLEPASPRLEIVAFFEF
jgi:hypothetical protein